MTYRRLFATCRPAARALIAAFVVASAAARSAAAVPTHHGAGVQIDYSRSTSTAYTVSTILRGALPAHARGAAPGSGASPLLSTPAIVDLEGVSARFVPVRVYTQVRTRLERFAAPERVRLSPALSSGKRKVLRPGMPGERALTERITRWDSLVVDRQTVGSELIRPAEPALVLVGAPQTFADFAARSRYRNLVAVMDFVATAYTAGTATAHPTGYTATGRPARYGVVAVDPRIIPLGSHLFIPGYGPAIAADTGGAIVGHRIDLCMESWTKAISFGRQMVKVYVLKE